MQQARLHPSVPAQLYSTGLSEILILIEGSQEAGHIRV